MLRYHLYVSASRITDSRRFYEVEHLVERARDRNKMLGITGALIFTGSRFAQFLEGPPAHVEAILQDIAVDHRHERINVLREGEASDRRFTDWSLSYSGPSLYVDRHIKSLIGSSGMPVIRKEEIDRLLTLLETTASSPFGGDRSSHTIKRSARA